MKKGFGFVVAAILLAGCGSSSNPGAPQPAVGQPTFGWLQQNVFVPSCVKCHSGEKPAGKYDITTYESIRASDTLSPGDPDHSELYTLVHDGKMPKRAPALSQEKVQALYGWIKAGAPKN